MNLKTEYKQALSTSLGADTDQLFLYWKGRVALYALLKAMNIKPGDEVILPAYTCVVVPNAILYLGAIPIYVDIDPETFNVNIDLLKNAITDKTKAIICQNTFGLSSNLEDLVEIAKQHDLFTIEDCTHGFGGTYNGKPNGTFCDAAFYSTQWNKPFSTGIGGFALVNNRNLLEPLANVNQQLETPSAKQKAMLKILYFVKRRLLVGATYWTLVKSYRYLSKHNLVVGSSSGEEITSIIQPANYFQSLSEVQIKEGLKNLRKLPEMLKIRRKNAEKYTEYLSNIGKNHVLPSLFNNHSFLKYPLLVQDRDQVILQAEKHKIELGEWLNSPIHPIQEGFGQWKLNTELFPNAVFAGKHIINLPTDTHHPERIIDFLKTINDKILDINALQIR
jgi:dTDP-4-amino-4,6-dideoxygalactose transaminase